MQCYSSLFMLYDVSVGWSDYGMYEMQNLQDVGWSECGDI